jgi:beta-RFAP synthase
VELASRVGRGVRSALGIHGFDYGGFLVEAGQREPGQVAPLVARVDFPESWRIVLIMSEWGPGLHGKLEQDAFARLPAPSPAWTDSLCRLVLLGLLPALAERDLTTFGEALFDFNARVGEAFGPVQGGRYATAQAADLVAFMRRWGIRGVGQSSWGPAVYAIAGDEQQAGHLCRDVQRRFALGANEVLMSKPRNQPACVANDR